MKVSYAVEDREAPFLSEEVARFVAQHFPAAAKAALPTNGKHAPQEAAHPPTNGVKAGSDTTNGIKAGSENTNGLQASAPPTHDKHTVPAGVADGCN